MTVLLVAVALGALLTIWVIAVVRRVRATDADVRVFARAVARSGSAREAQLEDLQSAIAGVDRTFEQWNVALTDHTQKLQDLVQRVPSVSALDVAGGSTRETRPVRIVSGDVPKSYAIASLKMMLEGRPAADPPRERPAKETLGLNWQHPVEFVVPTLGIRPKHSSSRSAVAVEDMLASKAVAHALVRSWPEAQVHTRSIDPGGAWDGHGGNICTFCRDSRNPATGVILGHPLVRARLKAGFVSLASESVGSPREAGIIIGGGTPHRSPSYAEEREIKRQGAGQPGQAILHDLALLARTSNPWEPEAKILIVAGIRAFGTLGAAEFLRTRWDELYEATRDGDFACLVRVKATYQVEIAEEVSIAGAEPDEVGTSAVELIPAEDVALEAQIIQVEPAA
jgi:hypothetical protein